MIFIGHIETNSGDKQIFTVHADGPAEARIETLRQFWTQHGLQAGVRVAQVRRATLQGEAQQ